MRSDADDYQAFILEQVRALTEDLRLCREHNRDLERKLTSIAGIAASATVQAPLREDEGTP